jgi:hypothetical protein
MSETLAPWIGAQTTQLLAQRGHAWLLAGPSGLGQYELALSLVQAWLCDRPTAHGACGQCPSCHGVAVRTQPDLCVLMPETAMLGLGWPLSEKAQADLDSGKRKPSTEIRVDDMRDAIEFSQRTSGRGRGKAVLVYPAERMNHVTANALLKTLEEPPGDVKFVLATGAAHQLLPTVRSRCLWHAMAWPDTAAATDWLQGQGVPEHRRRCCYGWLVAAPRMPCSFFRRDATPNCGRPCRVPWCGVMWRCSKTGRQPRWWTPCTNSATTCWPCCAVPARAFLRRLNCPRRALCEP